MILFCCASELGLPEDLSAIEVILYYYIIIIMTTTNLIASEAFFPSPDICARSSSLATRTWVCFHVVDSCATRWITADRVYSQLGWHPSVLVASALAHCMAGTIPL